MSDVIVTKNEEACRYEAHVGDRLAGVAEYVRTDGQVAFPHTEVDPEFGGRGIGSALVRHSLDDVREEGGLKVIPQCSFYVSWLDKHPDYADLLSRDAAP